MTIAEDLAREFEAINDYLKAVSDILSDGHMPDLSGLDGRVSELCLQMEQADPEIQQKYMARMNELLHKLDACENQMRAFHETLKGTNGHD